MKIREPGAWQGMDYGPAIEAIRVAGLPADIPPGELIRALARAGVLVVAEYYVPSPDELFGIYSAVGRELSRGMGGQLRWVMCRETHDALMRRHGAQRAAVPVDIRRYWPATELAEPVPEPESVAVADADYSTTQARLFGIPVRIDPAARRPLLEIDDSAWATPKEPE